jgi:CheY-like chemotaxis protein
MHKSSGLTPRYPLLLVDDEDSWLHSFRATLKSQGIDNVVLLNDGTKVMETLGSRMFCAVAIDLMMPDVSGEDLIPQIVEEFPELPVLVISGELFPFPLQASKPDGLQAWKRNFPEDPTLTRLLLSAIRADVMCRGLQPEKGW